jgi:hypothetical protein
MGYYFWSFWWLIFPIMGFLLGAFGMWMSYRAHRDKMELMKTLIQQGKDPAELAKMMGPGGPGLDFDPWQDTWGERRRHRWRAWGPMREWRRFVLLACLAAGFWLAGQYADWPGTEQPFTLAAIILGVMAAGSGAMAIIATVLFRGGGIDPPKNGG